VEHWVEVEPFAFGLCKLLSSECDIYAFFSFLLGGLLSLGTLFFSVVNALLKEAHHGNGWMPRLFGVPRTVGLVVIQILPIAITGW